MHLHTLVRSFARLHLLLAFVLALLALTSSCKPYLPPNTHPYVDCINAERSKIDALIASFWPSSGGAPDWGRIETIAIDAGVSIGGCALAEFVQSYLAPAPGTAAPPPELAVQAKDTLERYRNKHANNASFKTAAGEL